MLLTAAAQSTQPDYVALAMVLVLAVIIVIMVIRKAISNKKSATPTESCATEKIQISAAPGAAGQIKLHNVEPKTAAMVMAIVAEKTGKPLNELRFISIKEVQ